MARSKTVVSALPPRTPGFVVGSSPPPVPYLVATHPKETVNLSIAQTAQNREINLLPRRPRARTSATLVSDPVVDVKTVVDEESRPRAAAKNKFSQVHTQIVAPLN